MTDTSISAPDGAGLIMDRIAFAGDWHGSLPFATSRVTSLGDQGHRLLLHLGDFGLFPGPTGKRYLSRLEGTCASYDVTIAVTPGNHEDWARLDTKGVEDRGEGLGAVQWFTEHIAFLPRGHRFSIRTTTGVERTFVSLGGAPSVDFPNRTEGRDWWPSEQIQNHHVEQTIAGGHADIMIAHDSPGPPYAVDEVARILATNEFGWTDRALAYAAVGRQRMTRAFERVTPHLFVHGHYHCAGDHVVDIDVGGARTRTRVVALHRQHRAGNIARFDLTTLERVDDHPRR